MDPDDLIFIHERYRIQFTFIIRVYCWTGALRYRDIDLVLQRVPGGGWRAIYNISQRWVKNNRDPENVVFNTAGSTKSSFTTMLRSSWSWPSPMVPSLDMKRSMISRCKKFLRVRTNSL